MPEQPSDYFIAQSLEVDQSEQTIAILMCTFNGEAHLEEQLESIIQQTQSKIDVWVSDDGSKDSTLAILQQYKQNWPKGRFEILQGPREGFAANFLSLVSNSDIQADFFAYSDQDDIWERDKLSRAIDKIGMDSDTPILYCSRTTLIAECGKSLQQKSPCFTRPPSFRNALVQSLAGGNTMVINKAARQIVLAAGMQNIISHDWWTYLLITGAGGKVIYDPRPSVKYRQHSDNQIGANQGLIAKIKRLGMLLKGSFSEWNNIHISSLNNVRDLLNCDSEIVLNEFAKFRSESLVKRLYLLKKCGVYRQTVEGNIALWLATLLKKI